jgi:hypothetical protein
VACCTACTVAESLISSVRFAAWAQVVENYSEELGLGKSDSKHSHAIVAAHGAKKLTAMVAAVRTMQFMDRYGNTTTLSASLRCCCCHEQNDPHPVLSVCRLRATRMVWSVQRAYA